MKKNSTLLICSLLFLVSCTKQVIKQTPLKEDSSPVYYRSQGDTTTYVVEFSSKKDKKGFTKDFKAFLNKYPFKRREADTINQYFNVVIIPEKEDTAKPMIILQDETAFIETDVEIVKEIPIEDTVMPPSGGKVTIYTSRKFIDNTLSELIQVVPFFLDSVPLKDSVDAGIPNGFLRVTQMSPLKYMLLCTNNFINSSGRHISTFDLVQAWTDFIKKHPAEGLALFHNVKGIQEFIKGEEGIIPGFSVVNEKEIRILLEKPDPFILTRLYSPRLLPPSLSLGQFFIKKQQGNKFLLQQNAKYPFKKAFLKQCTIICGNDKNPIITYSLNKYDMVVLYKKKDLEYVQRTVSKKSHILPFSTERYFISLGSQSPELRKNLVHIIDPAIIHANAVKAEGDLITAIESHEQHTPTNRNPAEKQYVSISKTIKIVYNADDPISIKIGEKIFSDLTHTGTACKLEGLNTLNLESALIKRTYDIAIGWVPQNITTDDTERLRLATIWFEGNTDEIKRIANNLEIPLFSIKRYVLCKTDIQFYKDTLTGIYRQIK